MIRRLLFVAAMVPAVVIVVGQVHAADPADRVGFPRAYKNFTVLRATNVVQQNRLGTIYANGPAASLHDLAKLPYPNGSVIVMEWATPLTAADGTPLTGRDGLWQKGEIVRLDVMRREAGYGAVYGGKRAGEWEFASYKADGSPIEPTVEASACAACHSKPGTARDFVFRGRFPSLDTM
jgi:Cytochrome P460